MADNEEGPEPPGRAEEHYNNDDQNGAISNPVSMMLYFEACMRNHAAAYANAAAGAAQAAAHAAVAYHHRANITGMSPMHGGPPMMAPAQFYPLPCPPVMGGPPHFLVPVFSGVVPGLPPQFSLTSPPPLPLLSPPLPPQQHNNNKGEYRSKRERTRFSGRRRVRSDNDSSSSGGGGNSWFRPVKKKATSLIGKTGVTVLFEWASKRQITPTLTLKQDAKSFECIVYLPDTSDKDLLKEWGRAKGANKAVAKQEAARNALKALMPGIVFDEETGQLQSLPTKESSPDPPTSLIDELPNLARRLVIEHPKRARETTESDDSESAFRFKEGASVCSQLLHSLVQIDPQRLLSFPVFTYEKSDGTRGVKLTYTCKGSLKTNGGTIEASCVSATKRQSRHTVSALLLAKLFPECSTMTEVKAAAEARKEEFARRKKQHRDQFTSTTAEARKLDSRMLAKPSDPPLPRRMQDEIRAAIGLENDPEGDYVRVGVELGTVVSCNDDSFLDDPASSAFQKLSRQRQLISMLQVALHKFNDQDEDGRSLPEEITENDVGRTVLRLADPQDLPFIKRLCQGRQDEEEEVLTTEQLVVLWSMPNCFCLLLCRAIAAYEDPPLGCAVLTIGFSGSRRILRVSAMASESHLPIERFIECLRGFGTAMNCDLRVGENFEEVNGPALLRSYVNKRKPIKKSLFSSQLQSVREESAEESAEERGAVRRAAKPSKRSRVV